MTSLTSIAERYGLLHDLDLRWLHRLVSDFQLLADLAIGDIVLWLPTGDDDGYIAVQHARPAGAATLFYRDIVGQPVRNTWREQVGRAFDEGISLEADSPEWGVESDAKVRAFPVRRREAEPSTVLVRRPIAVITRHANHADTRSAGRLERTFKGCADELFRMIADGDFPDQSAPAGPRRGAARASDGLITLDQVGVVTFASPNALSAFTRLGFRGELEGESLAAITTDLIDESHEVDEALPLVVTGRAPWRTDIETRLVTLSVRALPLRRGAERLGAIVLVRDVTDMRAQEQTLITKDATIREIHHRVKNNLQTVAALLRIQSRRSSSDESRAALQNAERRVSSIAVVHDTLSEGLSQSVDFDQVFDRAVKLTSEVASTNGGQVRTERIGSFGALPSGYATPLALALTELVTNAVEHGLAGRTDGLVCITAERADGWLTVQVCDNGVGLPPGRVGSGLGTQIVKTLVTGELSGTIDWGARDVEGTEVTVKVPLAYIREDDEIV
ncbi:sensor histidine kinase [Agrococcus sp. Ld7]|uniref:sensor histidine kinase n=1 Tax=Agrococcus sp. Ld7 TaxID=649148 RepID=UPI00386CD7A1